MNKMIFATAIACSLTAIAAPKANPGPVRNHVPEKFEGFTPINPKAATRNHVLVANVAGAIPEKDWALCANYAASRIPINIFTNAVAAVPAKKVSGKAVVAVYVTDVKDAEPILAAPCKWSVVSVAGLKADNPSPSVLRDRYAKMILKGIAAACGSGATIEPLCSAFYGSRTLEGMDKTNITISPMAYFPMVETLRALGGDEAVSTVGDEEAE